MPESARELLEKYDVQHVDECVFLINREHEKYEGTVYRMNGEHFIIYKNKPIKVQFIIVNFWKEVV